jgi:hypothetical protein
MDDESLMICSCNSEMWGLSLSLSLIAAEVNFFRLDAC